MTMGFLLVFLSQNSLQIYSPKHAKSVQRQLIMQSTLEIRRAKKPTLRPVRIAPIMLVAAKVMPKRSKDVMIVPATPQINTDNALHMHE